MQNCQQTEGDKILLVATI